jgi:8-oxo-dGTP diphosphatase
MGGLPSRIETERLVLRRFEPADVTTLVPLIGDWNVARWLTRVPHPYTEADGHAWIEHCRAAHESGTDLNLAIASRVGGDLIGGIGLLADGEFGYWIGQRYWRRGFGREAASALVSWASAHSGATHIFAFVHPDNAASRKVLQAAGLSYEGDVRADFRMRGGPGTAQCWRAGR